MNLIANMMWELKMWTQMTNFIWKRQNHESYVLQKQWIWKIVAYLSIDNNEHIYTILDLETWVNFPILMNQSLI